MATAADSTVDPTIREVIHATFQASPLEAASIIDQWLYSKISSSGRRKRRTRSSKVESFNRSSRPPSRGAKASLYKLTQDLYKRNKKVLTDKIISGKTLTDDEVYPETQEVDKLFRGILESTSPPDDHPVLDQKEAQDIAFPITPSEVERATLGWRPSAPGPDEVSIESVKKTNFNFLAVAFNILLVKGATPDTWKTARTVLIPKEGDRKNPNNWRPITISSALQRLFHRILASRLNDALASNLNQRGFRNLDGTLANILILEGYITSGNRMRRGRNLASLDIRKAFDMVSHHSILRALDRFGVDKITKAYIKQTLGNAHTTIHVGKHASKSIHIQRGVKQGDPLSPVLFNLVMDELLDVLDKSGRGATLENGSKLVAMAFADDVIIVDDRDDHLALSLGVAEEFFRQRGMEINTSKSHTMSSVFTKGNSVSRTEPIFCINKRLLPMVNHLNSIKYLGHHFSTTGALKPSLAALPSWLLNLSRAKLKPSQKLNILKNYMIPRLYYALQTPKITAKTLKECDTLIRKSVKQILHLNHHTPNQYLHADVKDGGLGITNLRLVIPHVFLGRMEKLLNHSDETTKLLLRNPTTSSLRDRLRRIAPTGTPAAFWREEVSNSTFSRGLEASIEDAASRSWLYQPPYGWSGGDFVRAVHLRTGNLATVGIMSNPPAQRTCRGCVQCNETICHVLQRCPVTHWPRIHRHNAIVKKIAKHSRGRGWRVEEEPHVRHTDGRLYKPDLAIHISNSQVLITDVQVAWEAPRTLAETWDQKRAVYDNYHFRSAAAKRWPAKQLLFSPLIVGARGICPRANAQTAQLLHLPKQAKSKIVNLCIQWGVSIHRSFMGNIWRRNQQPVPRSEATRPPDRHYTHASRF